MATEPDFAILEQEEIELKASYHLLARAWQSKQDFKLLHGITILTQAVAPLEDLHRLITHCDAATPANSDMRDSYGFIHIEVGYDFGDADGLLGRETEDLRVRIQAPAVYVSTTIATITAKAPPSRTFD